MRHMRSSFFFAPQKPHPAAASSLPLVFARISTKEMSRFVVLLCPLDNRAAAQATTALYFAKSACSLVRIFSGKRIFAEVADSLLTTFVAKLSQIVQLNVTSPTTCSMHDYIGAEFDKPTVLERVVTVAIQSIDRGSRHLISMVAHPQTSKIIDCKEVFDSPCAVVFVADVGRLIT